MRPPEGAFILADRLARESTHHDRESPELQRRKLTVEVEIQPVNDDFEPVGEAFVAVTQDISTGGLGFVHTRAVGHRLLCIALRDDLWTFCRGKVFVLEVVRCDPVGVLYSVGGRFVAKIDDPRERSVHKQASASVRNSQERGRHVATTPIAPPLVADSAPKRELRTADPFIRESRIRSHGTESHNIWLVAGLVLTGTIGCMLFTVFNPIAKKKPTPITRVPPQDAPAAASRPAPRKAPTGGDREVPSSSTEDSEALLAARELPRQGSTGVGEEALQPPITRVSKQQAIQNEIIGAVPLEFLAALAEEVPGQKTTQPLAAQAADRIPLMTPPVRSDTELADTSSVPPRDTPAAASRPAPRKAPPGGDREVPSSSTEDSEALLAARELPRQGSTGVGEEALQPPMDPELHSTGGKPGVGKRTRTSAELESLYFMYADMKGWSTDKRTVQEKVRFWQQRRSGPVGLAIRFFETGEDGARGTGHNAEELYKSMPPAYWPSPARQ